MKKLLILISLLLNFNSFAQKDSQINWYNNSKTGLQTDFKEKK